MNAFSLTYDTKDLQQSSDELLMKCEPETELVRVDVIHGLEQGEKLSSLFTIEPPAPIASADDINSGNFFATDASLTFHPRELYKLLSDTEWPRKFEFKLSLLRDNEPVAYKVFVNYIGSTSRLYDANLSWRWNEEAEVDLNSDQVVDRFIVGTLQLKQASLPRAVTFQLKPLVEEDRAVVFPRADDIILNNGQIQVGIEKSETDTYRCSFQKVSTAGHYQLAVSRKWIEDSRITSLEVWWEGDFEDRKEFKIVLPELSAVPQITDVTFEHHADIENRDNTYELAYNGKRQPLGDFVIHITDPRGEGYELKGSVSVNGEQRRLPVTLQTANLPAGLSRLKGDKKSSVFKLKSDRENEVSSQRPFFKTYVHRVPLQVNTAKVDFSSRSVDALFQVHLKLGEGDNTNTEELSVKVAGSSITSCEILPKQDADQKVTVLNINTKVTDDKKALTTFRVANTRTQSGGEFISLRVEDILLKRLSPKSDTNWQLELVSEEGVKPVREDQDFIHLATLGSKENREFTFKLFAKDGLSSRAPREEMRLSYTIVHFIHEEVQPVDGTNGTAVRENRYVDFTVGPTIKRNFISIDLGTSAIVAAHSSSVQRGFDFDFIDLQAQLKRWKKVTAGDQPEEGTRFISSNVLLNNNSSIRADAPQNSLVELAPSFVSLFTNHERWLPNIKMLFGGMRMSRLENAFAGNLVLTDAEGETKYLSTDSPKVIEYSMQALVYSALEHYILPGAKRSFKDDDNLTEMVFTVPNNFPESYRKSIASWVSIDRTASHPGISVSFVSESDAIAYAYLDQEGEGEQKDLREESEVILTYDIGAGTVDLSLVERSVNLNKHSQLTVDVIGRIGLPKAGNYLDYVIAKIVWEYYGVGSPGDMITIVDPFERPDSSEARAYHRFIRNELKPALSKLEPGTKRKEHKVKPDASLFNNPIRQTIELTKIVKHQLFKDYINDVTTNALSKLFYNAFGENDYKAVSTILFSGRTSQMSVLRTSLMESLNDLPRQDTSRANKVDIDNWAMGDLTLNQEKLKGIVALGGLRYLKKYRDLDKRRNVKTIRLGERHITSSYGIIYNHSITSKPDWRYVEMVSPRNDDDTEVEHEEDIDLGGADRMYIVQTYEQTVDDIMSGFDAGRFTGDYTVGLNNGQPIIFEIEGINPDDIVTVSVSVKEGRSLRFKLLGEQSTSVLYRKDFQNYQLGYNTLSPALAESLWPFVDPRK